MQFTRGIRSYTEASMARMNRMAMAFAVAAVKAKPTKITTIIVRTALQQRQK